MRGTGLAHGDALQTGIATPAERLFGVCPIMMTKLERHSDDHSLSFLSCLAFELGSFYLFRIALHVIYRLKEV